MAILRIRVQATDETDDALRDVERNWDQSSDRIAEGFSSAMTAAATIAAAAIGQILETLNESIDRAQERAQSLQISLGPRTEAEDELADTLRTAGYSDAITGAAISAGRVAGVSEDPFAVGALANLERAGVASGDFTQFLQATGGATADEVGGFADLFLTSSQQAGVNPASLATQLGEYGPVLQQGGFGVFESLSFAINAEQQGVGLSRVGPALNQAIRRGQAAGLEPDQIREAITSAQGFAGGTAEDRDLVNQFFGAEGALRLQALADAGVFIGDVDLASGGPRIRSTDQELLEGGIDSLNPFVGAAAQFGLDPVGSLGLGDVPIIGDIAQIPSQAGIFGGRGAARVFTDLNQDVGSARSITASGGGGNLTQADIAAIINPDAASAEPAREVDRIAQIQAEIQSLQLSITRERIRFENQPPGFVYDAEKAAAANSALTRRLGLLTGELTDLLGQ